jgi:hypothetical protein
MSLISLRFLAIVYLLSINGSDNPTAAHPASLYKPARQTTPGMRRGQSRR